MTLRTIVAAACVLALALTSALWWVGSSGSGTKIVALFDKAVGVYPGSAVRILGVAVGSVKSVTPQGKTVRVEMVVKPRYRVPTDANAVIVAPSLVSDRFIQLTPAYDSGAELASGTTLELDGTETPVELDALAASVNELSTALGPSCSNANVALSNVLNTAAANLQGNGQLLNETFKQLSTAAATLSHSRGDLFATVDNLNKFTATLAAADGQVREFNSKLNSVTVFLAADRGQLGEALTSLATALGDVQAFVRDNKDKLSSNVDKLVGITQALVDQRGALAEVLDVAPLAATNFINVYDAASGSIAVRGNLNELTYPPVMLLCRTLASATPKPLPQTIADLCKKVAPLIDGTFKLLSPADLLSLAQQGKLPPLGLPIVDLPAQGPPR